MSGIGRWGVRLRRNPLWVVLPLEAALLLPSLELLPVWTDEHHTLQTASLPPAEIGASVAADVHPPLYFWLAHAWMQLPLPGSPIGRLRGLSALWVLLATVALWRLWLREAPERERLWFLAVWTLSGCLLLYGRMARSYSMQLFVGVLAIYAAMRWLERPVEWRRGLGYVAASAALLYTHYVPGIAVGVATGLVAARRMWKGRGPRPMVVALVYLGIVLALAPWIAAMAGAMNKWAARSASYRVFPQPLLDEVAKLAYWLLSFSFGESLPGLTAVIALPMAGAVMWMTVRGMQSRPSWLPFVLVTAAVAVLGVSRWVSVPFVPARLMFLLPFYLLLVVRGCAQQGRLGTVICAIWLAVSACSVAGYFRKEGFLNKGYVAPFDEIAELILRDSSPGSTVVILDTFNTDAFPLRDRLEGRARVLLLTGEHVFGELERIRQEGGTRIIWHVRNTHDISPGELNRRMEAQLEGTGSVRKHLFIRYSAAERFAMRLAGWEERPTHFYQALEVR